MLKGIGRKVQVAYKIWEIYCVRRIIYGLDIAEINKGTLEALDIVQNRVARLAMDATIWTKSLILQGETGFQPFLYRVAKEKLNLLTYLQSLEDERWAKKALNQQMIWLKKDKLDEKWATKKTPDYWLQGVILMARELEIPENLYLDDSTKTGNAIAIRKALIKEFNDRKTANVDLRDYLKYYRDQLYPKLNKSIYKWDDSYFWWQMKTGVLAEKFDDRFDFKSGLKQNERDILIRERTCPLCDSLDSIEHALWTCKAIKAEAKKENIFIQDLDVVRLLKDLPFIKDLDTVSIHEAFLLNLWLLNMDQPDQLKKDVGAWIRKTLAIRQRLPRPKKTAEA
jgi:hypothetical protein